MNDKSRNVHLSEIKIIYIYVLNIGSVDQNSISQCPITILTLTK